jgi:hypothetical protein
MPKGKTVGTPKKKGLRGYEPSEVYKKERIPRKGKPGEPKSTSGVTKAAKVSEKGTVGRVTPRKTGLFGSATLGATKSSFVKKATKARAVKIPKSRTAKKVNL